MSARDGHDKGFLARWSRLKRRGGDEPDAPTQVERQVERMEAGPDDSLTGTAPAAMATVETMEDLPEDLRGIDLEALDAKETDFARFLKEDVPEWLRRKALRKLWTSDPVLANLDGLNDYDEDFTIGGMAAAATDFMHRTVQRLQENGQNTEAAHKEPETRKTADEESGMKQPPATREEADNKRDTGDQVQSS